MNQDHRPAITQAGFDSIQAEQFKSEIPEDYIQYNPKMNLVEFLIACDDEQYTFSLNVPDGADEEQFQDLASAGILCTEETFAGFENMLLSTGNVAIIAVKDELTSNIRSIRTALSKQGCCMLSDFDKAILQSLEDLDAELSSNQPTEIPMTDNTDNIPTLTDVTTEGEMGTRVPEFGDQQSAEANNPASSFNQPESQTIMNNETIDTSTVANDAAKATADAAQRAADQTSAAADGAAKFTAKAAKDAADAVKINVERAADNTKGFLARHKKKILVATGLAALGTAGYYGWKRFGGSVVKGDVTVELPPVAWIWSGWVSDIQETFGSPV